MDKNKKVLFNIFDFNDEIVDDLETLFDEETDEFD